MADNTLTTDREGKGKRWGKDSENRLAGWQFHILFPTLEADDAVSDISTQTPVFSKSV